MAVNTTLDLLTDVVRSHARTAAQRGAAFLDRHGPAGWEQQIDLHRLDMEDECDCVLGQLYSDYSLGQGALELDDSDAIALGFILSNTTPEAALYTAPHLDAREAQYRVLTEEWTTIIRSRQEAVNRGS